MTTSKQKEMMQKLKIQVVSLKRKEKVARIKLRATLLKVRKMMRAYESKLLKDAKVAVSKLSAAEAALNLQMGKILERKAAIVKRKKIATARLKFIHKKKPGFKKAARKRKVVKKKARMK